MFFYLGIPQKTINFNKANIAAKRPPFSMQVVFGNAEAIKGLAQSEFTVTDNKGDWRIPGDIFKDFNFAGITSEGKTLVYKYGEIKADGYTLPLEETDYSPEAYTEIFGKILTYCRNEITTCYDENKVIQFVLLAAPTNQKLPLAKELLELKTGNLEESLARSDAISSIAPKNTAIQNAVKDYIMTILRKELSKKAIYPVKAIEIMTRFNLDKGKVIQIIAENTPLSNNLANHLFTIDEAATIKSFDLVKLYNDLLEKGALNTIDHKNNLYSAFSGYERQYKKLRSFGFESYYKYPMPKDWDPFMNEVFLLKKLFEKLEKYLNPTISKGAKDFFSKIVDDYDDLAMINQEAVKLWTSSGEWQKLVAEAIKSTQPDFQAIGNAIRLKYAEYFRKIEKQRDPSADDTRKGEKLIRFTVDPGIVKDVHANWRNLCVFVHKETAMEQPLWKGTDNQRRQALQVALDCYRTHLEPRMKA
jgi:hypothetical protein